VLALLAALLPLQLLPAAAAPPSNDPVDVDLLTPVLEHPIEDEVFYFVLPDRFNDADPSNNTGGVPGGALEHGYLPTDKGYYHGGDIRGIIERLDYIQDLGVTAIWMAPLFKNRPVQGDGTIPGSSAGYHGYWITDFTSVDPHFGTNEELRELVATAHARGIKVFFDIITNHTADVIDYAEGSYTYISKQAQPYLDATGQPFDDRAYAGTQTFPPLDPAVSFPYTPVFRSPEDATVKAPDWLDNPIYYHNRGDSTFSGENAEYGDFFGLDDLFTEHHVVVDGMIDIYQTWIRDVGIDGFRIDTAKHVNMEFWQAFSPAMLDEAAQQGNPDFYMFGEVFSGSVPFVSEYATRGQLPGVLDFPFQEHARAFASQSQPTDELAALFAQDDYYTDADGNAYRLPTFLGNHDMGRIGFFLKQDNPGASDAELLARDRLVHALMYFSRGVPVIYYGDEQGFTGDGGDKDAREDMFPSQVASYNDNDLIGTDATTAESNFDPSHPLYQTLQTYAALRGEHEALSQGSQIQRYSTDQAGIYAFSRIATDKTKQIEYVLAFNNAETEQSATFDTYQSNGRLTPVYPAGNPDLRTDRDGQVTVTVPPLSFVIYQAKRDLPKQHDAPDIEITVPAEGAVVTRRAEVRAELGDERYAEVTFAVQIGDDPDYTVIGTDDSPPYRVFYDVSALPVDTPLTFRAIANDLSDDTKKSFGQLTSATVGAVVGTPLAREVQVTFTVSVPPGTDATGRSVYIAGELNLFDPTLPAWDPGAVVLTQVDATHWTITFTGVEETVVQYKYTLGDWEHVEKSATCAEISNRLVTVTYGESGVQVVNDTVANWRNVPPCGD
jgi:glycosidase